MLNFFTPLCCSSSSSSASLRQMPALFLRNIILILFQSIQTTFLQILVRPSCVKHNKSGEMFVLGVSCMLEDYFLNQRPSWRFKMYSFVLH